MNFDTIATISFIVLFSLIILLFRKKFRFHSFAKVFYIGMLRTNFGLKLINKIANKLKKPLRKLSPFIIFIGFLGLIIVVIDLVYELSKLFSGNLAQSVGIVLPIEAKGVFYVPFLYWLISIVVVIFVHEGGHGIMARVWNLKVKKTGIAFLAFIIPIIPAAFVEPDEKQLRESSRKKQLSVYAAGPFANIAFAFIILLILNLFITPAVTNMQQSNGLEIVDVPENSPAFFAGITNGEIIKAVNGKVMDSVGDFTEIFAAAKIGDMYQVITNKNNYQITLARHPATNEEWFGVFVQEQLLTKNPNVFKSFFIWFEGLLFWLFLLNLGVGLFNLVPIGPIDGGKMLHIVLEKYTKKKRAKTIWKIASVFFLLIILANIIPAFV